MTHHSAPPLQRIHLRANDTVDMPGEVTGPSGRFVTASPCCNRRIFVSATDVAYMERRPSYTVTRTCASCDWPYFIHIPAHGTENVATFTVCQPPR